MKKSLLALSMVTALSASNALAIDLPNGAHLSITSNQGASTGSRFTLNAGALYTYLVSENGIIVGANSGDQASPGGASVTMPHGGAPDALDVGSVTKPWSFFFQTGYDFLIDSANPESVGSNSFTGGTVGGVDMSSWIVAWNTVSVIPMGGCQFGNTANNGGFNGCILNGVDPTYVKTAAQLVSEGLPHVNAIDTDTGFGVFTWDGTDGGDYTITHSAHVPAGDPSGFEGALYELQLTGVVTLPDTTPDAFAFTDVTDVQVNTIQTHASFTVAGVTPQADAAISIASGEYSIDGGAFTSVAGTVNNGQTVAVRHTSSTSFGATVDTVLTIDSVSNTFSSTTESVGAFAFTDALTVGLFSVQSSDSITVSGITTTAPISITGGSYEINATGGFVSTAGTVSNGDTVQVQHTSSAAFSTAVDTVLTVGNQSDTYTSTTLAQDIVPDAFLFTDDTDVAKNSTQTSAFITVAGINNLTAISIVGGLYQVNGVGGFASGAGNVNNGDTVEVQHTSSGAFSTAVDTVLTIGGVSDTYSSTTLAQDITPDAFMFVDGGVTVAKSSTQTSAFITVAGINDATAISITGGSYQVNGIGGFVTVGGNVNNGDTVEVQHIHSNAFSETLDTVLTIGGVSDTYSSTTLPIDTTPDAFTFVDVGTPVTKNSTQTSAFITVVGVNSPSAISITGGSYQVNGVGGFIAGAGNVNNGDTIEVQHTHTTFSETLDTVLTIGGVSDIYSSTSEAVDLTPDAFTFIAGGASVAKSSIQTSAFITVSGINDPSAISITGGSYQVNGVGGFIIGAGVVNNGDTVEVQHTHGNFFSETLDTVLTIGGVFDTYSSTTLAQDITPDAFTFVDGGTTVAKSSTQTSASVTVAGVNDDTAISIVGGSYQVNGLGGFVTGAGVVNNGDTVEVQHTHGNFFSETLDTVVTIGGVSDTYSSTTLAQDLVPDAFSFIDQANVATNTVITSVAITVNGINDTVVISVTGGSYRINGAGLFITTNSTVVNGDTVEARHTSFVTNPGTVDTIVTIGGVSDTFTSSTNAADTTPDPFVIVDGGITVALGSTQTSASFAVAGINAASPISVAGGSYQINGVGGFVTVAGNVNNGNTIEVRHTASGSFSTTVDTVLTIGGVSDTYSTTTLAQDTTPDAFAFVDGGGAVAKSSVQTSASITVAGINDATVITVVGGSYQVNGVGGFVTGAGNVNNGDTVEVRHIHTATFSEMLNTTLTIGGVSDIYSSTTLAQDITPDNITFVDGGTAVAKSSVQTSASITVAGVNDATAISVTGGSYQINGAGGFVTAPGTVNNGDTVEVRHTHTDTFSETLNTVLTLGNGFITDTYSSTTLAQDITPDAFTLIDGGTTVAQSSVQTSASITVVGVNDATAISVTGGSYQINGAGGFVTAPSTVNNGDTVEVQHTHTTAFNETLDTVLTIGGVSDTYSSTTLLQDITPDGFTLIDGGTTVAQSSTQTSASITVAGVNDATAISVTGGSYQINGLGGFVTAPGTVDNGDTVEVQHTHTTAFNETLDTLLTIGGVSDTYSSTTLLQDITPDGFTLIDGGTTVAQSSTQTSASITVAGVNDATTISVTGGSYQINGAGGFVTAAGTVDNGDTVEVQHTHTTAFNETLDTLLTIGGVSDTYSSTTLLQDITPSSFTFIDGGATVAQNSTQTSASITVAGVNDATAISVTGGSYQINGVGGFVTAAGTVDNGDTVEVQHTASASFSTTTDTVLDIGGVSDTYSSTTLDQDLVPDALAFTSSTNAALNSVQTSDVITVTGINDPVTITVVGGSYQINGIGGFVTSAGTIVNGDTVEVQHTASAINSTIVTTTATISGVGVAYNSTTIGNALPIAANDSGLIDVSFATDISLDVTANDSDSDGAINRATVVIASPATNGGTLVDGVTGVITYTPTPGFIGTDSFTYTINDVIGDTSLAGSVTISVADPSAIAGLPFDALLSITLGTNTVNPTDGEGSYFGMDTGGGTLVITPLTNDNGLQISTSQFATGSHGGNPDSSENPNIDLPWLFFNNTGMHQTVSPVTILTDDGAGNVTLDLTGWSVTWNTIPNILIDSGAHSGGVDGVASLTCTVNCAIGDTYILDYFATIPPSPLHSFGGVPYTLHLEGTIGQGAVPVTAPVVSSDSVALAPSGNITIDLTDNVFDVFANTNNDIDFSTLIFAYSGGGTLVDNGDGTLDFTDVDGVDTLDSFSYSVSNTNGETSNQQTVTINISSGNLPPTASSFAVQVEPVNATLIDISGFVSDDSAIDVTSVSASQSINGNATTSVDAVTGVITYTPNAGFVGEDSFSFTVRDDSGVTSNIALVTVFVNEAPVAIDDIVVVDRNSAIDINVPLNDTDTDGTVDFSTVVLETLPLDGTATLDAATGVVTYTPNNNYLGPDTFDYTVMDNAGGVSNSGTVDITVVNATPVATALPARPEFNTSNPLVTSVDIDVTSNDTDADGTVDTTSVIIVTDVTNGSTSIDALTGVVTYTPTPGFLGLDQFTYTVGDNDGGVSNIIAVDVLVFAVGVMDPNTFLWVTQANITPATVAITPAVGEGSWFNMEVTPGVLTHVAVGGFNDIKMSPTTFQPASVAAPDIDNPWIFFGNLGVHQTLSPVTILVDDTVGNVSLDLSGWSVSWNGIVSIPMNSRAHSGGVDGIAQMTCAVDCTFDDTYVLDYYATVPDGDPSGFGNVKYHLHLEGKVSDVSQVVGGTEDAMTQPPAVATTEAHDDTGAVVTVTAGPAAGAAGNTSGIGLTVAEVGVNDPLLNPNDGQQCIGGCIDFTASGLTFGSSVEIVVKLSATIPAGAVYRKLDNNGNWSNFDTSQGDQIGSQASVGGMCQNSDGIFASGLRSGNDCLYLKIEDGGPNDSDRAADGSVDDPGGVFLAGSPNVPASSTDGCSMSATPVALRDRADWLVLALFFGMAGLLRHKRKYS